jgi:hypothetical protein
MLIETSTGIVQRLPCVLQGERCIGDCTQAWYNRLPVEKSVRSYELSLHFFNMLIAELVL